MMDLADALGGFLIIAFLVGFTGLLEAKANGGFWLGTPGVMLRSPLLLSVTGDKGY